MLQKLEFFSDPRNDRLTRVRGEVGELKNVLVDNIDKVRGLGRAPWKQHLLLRGSSV